LFLPTEGGQWPRDYWKEEAMLAKLMIDAMVHQTTVLIAGLSTAAGIRAPLAHVADQVFLDLSRAIEEQGVGRKVVADMFGMALRTYQKKVQRLAESSTASHRTLWEAVLDYLEANSTVTRAQLLRRFAADGEDNVAAVVNDLVESGVLERKGRGTQTSYTLRSTESLLRARRSADRDELATLVWVLLYRRRGATLDELTTLLGRPRAELSQALRDLADGGRITASGTPDALFWQTATMGVPVGESAGWAGAVIDHYQTVCNAIVAKLLSRGSQSHADDVIGGATLGFDVYPGHPYEQEVYALLRNVRRDVNVLWSQVSEYNRDHPEPEAQKRKVYFYFGQTVQDSSDVAVSVLPAPSLTPEETS
jgi:hypothetical protein